jgi:hypothetical protein
MTKIKKVKDWVKEIPQFEVLEINAQYSIMTVRRMKDDVIFHKAHGYPLVSGDSFISIRNFESNFIDVWCQVDNKPPITIAINDIVLSPEYNPNKHFGIDFTQHNK